MRIAFDVPSFEDFSRDTRPQTNHHMVRPEEATSTVEAEKPAHCQVEYDNMWGSKH